MGLDVGVVDIEYLERPKAAVYAFLRHLAENADGADWRGGTGEETFVQYVRGTLLEQANEFASRNAPTASERAGIRAWIDGLPWKDDVIMLHLSG